MLALALSEAAYEVETWDGQGDRRVDDFDAVLLDVRLGHRTGRDVLAAMPALLDRPLVLMTASASGDALDGFPEAAPVLRKPFDLSSLEVAVAACLGAARGGRGAPTGD